MNASGDYLTPRFRHRPFLDRPILHYWLLAGSSAVFGESDFACRFASFAGGTVAVLATAAIAGELFGATAGALAAFVFATSVGGVVLRQAVGHDTTLVAFVALSAWCALRWLRAGPGPNRWALLLACGAAIGLGVLSKGLLGVLLPALAVVPFLLVPHAFDSGGRRIGRPSPAEVVAFLAVVFAVSGWWYLAMEWQQRGYLHYFFGERHLAGFFTGSQKHGGKSALVYIPFLFVIGAPGIFLLALRPKDAAPRDRTEAACWAWFAATVFFFAVAGSRNPTYLLPALVPLVVLIARRLERWFWADVQQAKGTDNMSKSLPQIWLSVHLVVVVAVIAWFGRSLPIAWMLAWFACVLVLLVWSLKDARSRKETPSGTFGLRRRRARWLTMQAVCWSGTTAAALLFAAPPIVDVRSAARAIEYIDAAGAGRSDGPPVLWLYDMPPSATLYGKSRKTWRVIDRDLEARATEPTLFVCRTNHVPDVRRQPFLEGARQVDFGGKYTAFWCGPPSAVENQTPTLRR